MNRSEAINELAAALAAAQGEMENAAKDANNAFRGKYATLASMWDAARVPLSKNGLAVVQTPEESEVGILTLTTTLLHSSGQWVASTFSMPVGMSVIEKGPPPMKSVTPWGYGSALTYARRYALAAIVGIAPDDDDGEAASQPQSQRKPAPAPEPDDDAEVEAVRKESRKRERLLARIVELGGDMGHAIGLSTDAMVAYGKSLAPAPAPALAPEPETEPETEPVAAAEALFGDGSDEAALATPVLVNGEKCKITGVVLLGTVTAKSDAAQPRSNTLRFRLGTDEHGEITCVAFGQRSVFGQWVTPEGECLLHGGALVTAEGTFAEHPRFGDQIILDKLSAL